MSSKSRPGMTRLATIPASPFIEQTSPILERAGQIQGENSSSVIAQSAAAAAMAISKTGPYSQSHPDVRTEASASDPALGQKSPPAEKPTLERSGTSFSVSRKPLRNSQELSGPKQPDYPQQQPQQQQWNQQQYQYSQQQRQQQGGYGYTSYTPPQQYPRNPASGGAEIPPQQQQQRHDQSPYSPQGGRNSPYHQIQPGAQQQPMHHGGMHIPTGRARPPMQQGGSYGPPPLAQDQQQGGPYPGPQQQQQMQGSPTQQPTQQQGTQQGPGRWI